MTRERCKELLPIIQAFADGKVIQVRAHMEDKWEDADNANFYERNEYRIKPEPREFWIAIDANKRVYDEPVTSDGAEIIHVREVTNE